MPERDLLFGQQEKRNLNFRFIHLSLKKSWFLLYLSEYIIAIKFHAKILLINLYKFH